VTRIIRIATFAMQIAVYVAWHLIRRGLNGPAWGVGRTCSTERGDALAETRI
jgi:hypothetical protein